MSVTYFKRLKMEMDLQHGFPVPHLAPPYVWVPWREDLLETHAEVKFRCFHEEIDAAVFPSLSEREGCLYLMGEIRRRPGFLPLATWLIADDSGYCGTVQGVRERNGVGAIQNLGVDPLHRNRGLGSALLLKALAGFAASGISRAFLEVTAQNAGAVRLYRRVGFRSRKTLYKAVDTNRSLLAAEVADCTY
jgi:ribosomal protein S18 acetylase RimI-like enzyme